MLTKDTKAEPIIVRWLAGLMIAALTAAYLKFHADTHTVERLSTAAEYLLQGKTHWLTFQNRLLSPALIKGIQIVTGLSWLQSFQILIGVCLGGGSGFLLWRSWKNTGKSILGIKQAVAWFSLAFLFNHIWSYPWDYTGAVLFMLVMVWGKDCFHSLADLKSKRLAVLLILLILNRESSLIVFAGLILTAIAIGFHEKKWSQSLKAIFLLSLASLSNIIGVIYVRHALFTSPTRPLGQEGPEAAVGNFNSVIPNLRNMVHADSGYEFGGTIIVTFLFIVCSILLLLILRDLRRSTIIIPGKMLIRSCFCLASVAIVFFANMAELRAYFELIPIAILLAFESRSHA